MANAYGKAVLEVAKRAMKDQKDLIEYYRNKQYAHERMIGQLKTLLDNDVTDKALDIVRDEFYAIHGPSDV